MLQTMNIACVQLNTGSDIAANAEAITRYAQEAKDAGAEIISLPENAYFMRGSDQAAPENYSMDTHPGVAHASQLAQRLNCWILIGSLFVAREGKWANRSLLFNPCGGLVTDYDKIHLFDADFGDGECYRESNRIAGGDAMKLAEIPCGTIGFSVCYDLRFPKLFRAMAHAGATILSIPAAFTYRTGVAHWHVLLRARAIENGCYVIAPAQCGTHPGGRRTYGHSLIIDPWGEIVAEAGEEPGFIMAPVDPLRVEAVRRQLPVLGHEREFHCG
jgi:predicted amidohydrolase